MTTTQRSRRQRGSMAAELAVIAPVLLVFLMLLAGLGRLIEARGAVYGAARDAARAASLQRTPGAADAAAQQATEADLAGHCINRPTAVRVSVDAFAPGNMVTYEITCEASLKGLGVFRMPDTKRVTARASAPLDVFRRSG
ncbi:MAG TPA: TadE family protein [Actinomycetes bacterium]